MSLGQKILAFIFGNEPDIFDKQGQVVHKHPQKKWDAWQNRFKNDSQYNWRTHVGVSGTNTPTKNPKK